MDHSPISEAAVSAIIEDFVQNSPANTLKAFDDETAFDLPLVGFSSGDDPIYDSYGRIWMRALPDRSTL